MTNRFNIGQTFTTRGKARFDFEMASCRIVDIATLPTAEWAKALRS